MAWRMRSYACVIHLHSHFQNGAAMFSEFVTGFEIEDGEYGMRRDRIVENKALETNSQGLNSVSTI